MTQMETHQPQTRFKTNDRDTIPRFLVRAMFALVMTVLALVSYARLTDMPLSATPPASTVLVERSVILHGELSGAATVTEPDGTMILDLGPDDGGFVSGVYRVIVHERTKNRVALDTPVILQRQENGRVSIHDPSTGWSADLMGFGIDNARVFARLLQ